MNLSSNNVARWRDSLTIRKGTQIRVQILRKTDDGPDTDRPINQANKLIRTAQIAELRQ